MTNRNRSNIEALILSLPDPQTARVFLQRLETEQPLHAAKCRRHPLLLSRLLTIAAYSPFLAENLLRHADDIDWFEREMQRGFGFVKTTEQMSEDLSRFLTRMFNADEKTLLLRFRNREFLRIYLRDCLNLATLAEVTEELSNLADVILQYALKIAMQEIINKHGAPQLRDERGRITQAEFAIVALGKLGCRELNYASDIDLMFLYCGSGETAGDGRNPYASINNKDFFIKVAQHVIKAISGLTSEGAVYRIDLRLRPYGRDGDLVWEIERAADYYHNKAESWERQMLIRARATAGSEAVFTQFFERVRDRVFSNEPAPDALMDVRRAKEKIDRQIAKQTGGFNVKLGIGGIREIEFIAQGLQLQHGGREPWVRAAQTLIVLARLAEKGFLSESERAALSSAYAFFRMVEHRLQMEHGAQTHTLPLAEERLELLARRCGYQTASDIFSPKHEVLSETHNAAIAFRRDTEMHAANVRAIYQRVFANGSFAENQKLIQATASEAVSLEKPPRHPFDEENLRYIHQAGAALTRLIASQPTDWQNARPLDGQFIENLITRALPSTINPTRALKNLIAWAESFSTYNQEHIRAVLEIMQGDLQSFFARLITTFSSQYLSSILVSRPQLTAALMQSETEQTVESFTQIFRRALSSLEDLPAKADRLRRLWHEAIIRIGYCDLANVKSLESKKDSGFRIQDSAENSQADTNSILSENSSSLITHHSSLINGRLRESNREQTALAEVSLRLTTELTLEAFGAPHDLPFAVMALGRLGHAGMDYGSDLDLLIVFDDAVEWEKLKLENPTLQGVGTAQEFYAKFTAELLNTLSTITREGFIYRVDLRLRPEGKNGQLAQGFERLLVYLSERASAWEHSAYLKVREVAGDLSFGARVREAICETVFNAASKNRTLKAELFAMRKRLENEKAKNQQRDIKWGAGGMTDVYFITRFLQLRDRLYFPTEQGTAALIQHLGEQGALDNDSAHRLFAGYTFLRRIDHWMRILLDRPTSLLPASHLAMNDLCKALSLNSIEEFEQEYACHTSQIRRIFFNTFL
ncbi:MAG: hypothetical protein AB1757_13630 [Acidobacteriota bacterium]